METNFREFLRLCAKYNPEVTADNICDLVTCSRCPFDHMSDEDYTVCQSELDIALEDVRREYSTEEHDPVRIEITEGLLYPYYIIREDSNPENVHKFFKVTPEDIRALAKLVAGREIEWVPGYNVLNTNMLGVPEFNKYIKCYEEETKNQN